MSELISEEVRVRRGLINTDPWSLSFLLTVASRVKESLTCSSVTVFRRRESLEDNVSVNMDQAWKGHIPQPISKSHDNTSIHRMLGNAVQFWTQKEKKVSFMSGAELVQWQQDKFRFGPVSRFGVLLDTAGNFQCYVCTCANLPFFSQPRSFSPQVWTLLIFLAFFFPQRAYNSLWLISHSLLGLPPCSLLSDKRKGTAIH